MDLLFLHPLSVEGIAREAPDIFLGKAGFDAADEGQEGALVFGLEGVAAEESEACDIVGGEEV